MKKPFGILLIIAEAMLIFIEVFFGEVSTLTEEGSEINYLYGSLLFLTCLLGFSLINIGKAEVAWLRVLSSMMCCALVYQFYPIWSQFVQLAMGRSSHYILKKSGATFKECQLVSMHVLLILAYVPCFDPQSTAQKHPTNSLGFLTKPLMIVLPAIMVWPANQLCVELIATHIDIRTPLASSAVAMLELLECGAFATITAWMIRKNERRHQRQVNQYEVGKLNLLGGVMAVGFFILYAGQHSKDSYTLNTVLCIVTEFLWIMSAAPFRRLVLGVSTTPSHIFQCIIGAGVASIAGLSLRPGMAMLLGFVIAVIITLYQWLITSENNKGWQTTGPLIMIGAIAGLFISDVSRFSASLTYFLATFSILFGAIFGYITGYVLNKLSDYSLEDFGRPKELENPIQLTQ